MSRNVAEKIANGDQLDDQDIQYAVERGIQLPDEYGVKAGQIQHNIAAGFGQPPVPVVDGGSYPAVNNAGPGLFLTGDQLSDLKNEVLRELAEVAGVEASGKKADLVSALTGAPSSAADDENEGEPE